MGLQRGFKSLHFLEGFTIVCRRLKRVVTKNYKGLQGVTKGYKGVQRVTKGY